MQTLKVKKDSVVKSVAGAIAGECRKEGECEIIAIGPAAVNQAVKAIATARGFAVQDGYDFTAIPTFTEVEVENEKKSAIKFSVKKI